MAKTKLTKGCEVRVSRDFSRSPFAGRYGTVAEDPRAGTVKVDFGGECVAIPCHHLVAVPASTFARSTGFVHTAAARPSFRSRQMHAAALASLIGVIAGARL